MKIDVEINGVLGSKYNVYLQDRPSIPSAIRKVKAIEIPGRDGVLTELGEFEPTEFEMKFNFITKKEDFHNKCDAIKNWLFPTNCKLIFSDNPDWFYKISYFEIEEIERLTDRVGVFTVTVHTVDGLKYSTRGERELDIADVKLNQYIECKPIYKIAGEGMCTLTVNGKTMRANVGQNLTIDTEKMLAYRQDGTIMNTAVAGDYEDLYLKSGNNTISISPNFVLKIIPNWRCL